jgi:protein-tyrosine-phosphatase/predicted ATP-grasp superfamily ATP-dependent carboligase
VIPSGGRALVLGSDTRSFLSVIRSLGRAGVEVHVAWAECDSPALRSRYIRAVHEIPLYSPRDGGWLEALGRLLREPGFDAVIPCQDAAVLALHLHRSEMASSTRLCIPNESAYERCCDKGKTYEMAESLSIPLPRQARAGSVGEIEELAASFGMPLVLKPAASVSAEHPDIRNLVRKVRRQGDIAPVAGPMLARGPLLVQQNFVGSGVGVEVLCQDGEILAAFQHERVHEPLTGGGSTYRKSVPLSPELLEAARRLMQELRYTGAAMVEFKVNSRTGRWVLIEINGRFWGSLPLTIAAGADFPRYLYELMVRGRTDFPRGYRTGLYCRNWRLDLGWLRRNLQADRGDPTLQTVPLWKLALEPLRVFRERSDTFTLDDPHPGLFEAAQLAGRTLRPAAWMLPGMRARMRRRAGAAARDARRILVVCKGNICRSPFAEAYLKRRSGEDLEVESSGHYPAEGRVSPPAAREAARRFGLDLEPHRSRMLTRQQLERADLVLIFEPEQEWAVHAYFPGARKKLHYLGAFGEARSPAIRDPWGGNVEEFLAVYREIGKAIDALLAAPSRSFTTEAAPGLRA